MTESKTFNMDCLEAMKQFPDKYFDLAVTDPPYGSADSSIGGGERFGGRFDIYKQDIQDGRNLGEKIRKKIVAWDTAPGKEYFDELARISKRQIVWGGNYFGLPPNRCFLVWVKTNIPENFSMGMAEYAWTNMGDENPKVFHYTSLRGKESGRFHPTEKPVALYRWIFGLYAKPGDKILDTHLGSGSSRIAAYDMGLDFVGYELDEDYFEKQEQRFEEYTSQMRFI